MKHVCAWCKCETAPPDGIANDDLISHGMCENCKRGLMLAIADAKQKHMTNKHGDQRWK